MAAWDWDVEKRQGRARNAANARWGKYWAEQSAQYERICKALENTILDVQHEPLYHHGILEDRESK
jgi:hypothetical protein